MLNTGNVITFFAPYTILNSIVSCREGASHVNFFVDLKNVTQTLYMKDAVKTVVESTKQFNSIDLSLFHSIFHFISYYKTYCVKKGLTCNFYFFFETGQSFYHFNIYKKYKENRKIDKLFGLDTETKELFNIVYQKNLGLVEKIANKLPTIKVFRLKNFEADFLPYYLIHYRNIGVNQNEINIILSSDHDMWQCVNNNTFIFSRYAKQSRVISEGEVLSSLFKDKMTQFDDRYYTMILSIIGDRGDDIPGIKGIGIKRAKNIYNELKEYYPDPFIFLQKIIQNVPLFDDYDGSDKYMILVKEHEHNTRIVSRNMKLISFELISRALENPPSLSYLDIQKHIDSILYDDAYTKYDILIEALKRSNIYVDEDAIGSIYYPGYI